MSDWDARAILAGGSLPFAPAELADGESAPVALWTGGDRAAAIMTISLQDATYLFFVDVWLKSDDSAEWSTSGPAGSSWTARYGTTRAESDGGPQLTGFTTTFPSDDGVVCLATGAAPVGVGRVVVSQGHRNEIVSAEPRSGAFLVRIDAGTPVTVTAG